MSILIVRLRYLLVRLLGCTGYVETRYLWGDRDAIIAHDGDTCPVHER